MINRLKKLLGARPPAPADSNDRPPKISPEQQARMEEWHDHKSRLMEQMLGPQHDTVMHAIFPYAIGGGLDLYYYPHGLPGTAVATKELSELPNQGSKNRSFSCYELVMHTRHPLNLEQAKDQATAFGRAHSNINLILNAVAPFSAQASLNPNETCEFPAEAGRVGGKCVIFASAGQRSDDLVKCFGLLTVIEVFRSEMEFARKHKAELLFERLKAAGHFPYSDLERDPVA